jgi:hypothetical protein
MTEDPQSEDYLDLFKPKSDAPEEGAPRSSEPDLDKEEAGEAAVAPPVGGESRGQRTDDVGEGPPGQVRETRESVGFSSFLAGSSDRDRTLRTVGVFAGGGCLLLILVAVVVFAFVQVFGRRDGDDSVQYTPTATAVVAITASPRSTVTAVESPLLASLVTSNDVRLPVALPERLTVGGADFSVQAVGAPPAAWPDAPADEITAHWVNGTVVNFVMGLAPTPENENLLSGVTVGDVVSLRMSTGLILTFNVEGIATGVTEDPALFDQVSPRLTLALITDDPSQRKVVTAGFASDQMGEEDLLAQAAIGLVGTPVNQGPVRVTVIETYQAAAGEAGLPSGTGYLLMDVKIENVGAAVLEPDLFQTFVSSAAGGRYPLTFLAEQFSHYGIPVEALAPGETVIGSFGYLVPGAPDEQIRWTFNPIPGSSHWVVVPISVALPPIAPTPEPPGPVGFARVTVDGTDVFADRDDGLLDIGLRIENISEGRVQVTEESISLSSWTDGELTLVAPAPALPWTIEPGELRLFQLQFELPTADSALLNVLGYTFSLENLGGE